MGELRTRIISNYHNSNKSDKEDDEEDDDEDDLTSERANPPNKSLKYSKTNNNILSTPRN